MENRNPPASKRKRLALAMRRFEKAALPNDQLRRIKGGSGSGNPPPPPPPPPPNDGGPGSEDTGGI